MTIVRRTLKQQIREALAQRILDGRYAPGERLVELQIAKEMGTSQAPVREALRELESLGLVESEIHRGTRVRRLGEDDLKDIFETRAALEEHATRLATTRLDQEGIVELGQRVHEMVAAAAAHDLEGVIRKSTEFHRRIIEAAGSRSLLRAWNSLQIEIRTLISLARTGLDLLEVAHSHWPIVDAIADGDAIAAGLAARNHQHFFASKPHLERVDAQGTDAATTPTEPLPFDADDGRASPDDSSRDHRRLPCYE